METINILQHYWWALISLLGAILVFLMFVQGGQSLLFGTARNESDRTLILNTFGHKWELTFTTLVTFGGAFFASFPLFYSTSFGGAYWVWILILITFVFRGLDGVFKGPYIFSHTEEDMIIVGINLLLNGSEDLIKVWFYLAGLLSCRDRIRANV